MMSSRDKGNETVGLRFVDVKPISLSASCAKLSEVLNRTDDEGISPNDLDDLRTELLQLQETLQRRVQDVAEESEVLAEMADKPLPSPCQDRKKASTGNSAVSGHKRREPDFGTRLSVDAKRVKSSSSDPSSTGGSPAPASSSSQTRKPSGIDASVDKKSKLKSRSSKSDQLESELQLAKAKQDASNKFWTTVEQYCAPITEQDIKALRQMATKGDNDQELYTVPPLGVHYSSRWAQEISGDQDRSNTGRSSERKGKVMATPASFAANGECSTAPPSSCGLAREDSLCPDSVTLGPLTQRLVAALIEDKKGTGNGLRTSPEATSPAAASVTASDSAHDRQPVAMDTGSARPPASSQINDEPTAGLSQHHWVVSNAKLLEARIHQQLIELGIMEADEIVGSDEEEDEVLAELRRRQNELKAVAEYNRQLKLTLVQRAELELEKQILQEKVRKVDAEVVECLKKITTSKQRKKPLTRKERDAAFQTLSQRASLVKHLNQLQQATDNLFATSLASSDVRKSSRS